MRPFATGFLLAALSVSAQDLVDFTGWMNRGVAEFESGNYPQAAAAFERAVASDPSRANARLYLGSALMQQYIPGADAPDNLSLAELARRQFLQVLDLDHANPVALASLGSLSASSIP